MHVRHLMFFLYWLTLCVFNFTDYVCILRSCLKLVAVVYMKLNPYLSS